MAEVQRKNLSRLSLFSGSTLAMAFSMLSVIVLLIWWQRLINSNLENQYRFFASEIAEGEVSNGLRKLIENQDARLASQLFTTRGSNAVAGNAPQIIAERLQNRQKMVLYEQTFFSLLLLSGHLFFLYIYFRERLRRRQTEETILLATHELRQPLQSLSLALEILAPKAKGKSRTAIESGLRDIARLGDLIRFLAGAFVPGKARFAETTIDHLGNFVNTFLSDEFPDSTGQIRKTIAATPAFRLRLSAELLRFLLRNLVGNALKYANGPVEISASVAGGEFIFRVANSGDAISASDFRKIGEAFYRRTTSPVQNTTGFGLGLYLCGRLARSAQGRLTLENDDSGRTVAALRLRSLT